MRLVTFETAEGERRIGALTADNQVVDLRTAAALYLRDVEKEGAYYRIAQARLPNDMRGLFEGGDQSLALARNAFEYVQKLGARARAVGRSCLAAERFNQTSGSDHTQKVFSYCGQLPRASCRSPAGRLFSSRSTMDRLLPECGRDYRTG